MSAAAPALAVEIPEARGPETPAPPEAVEPETIYTAGAPTQVRMSVGMARWIERRAAAVGWPASDVIRYALHRLDRFADSYDRPALLARRPWAIGGVASTRASFRLTPAERAACRRLSARFARKPGVAPAVRLAVYIGALEAAEWGEDRV